MRVGRSAIRRAMLCAFALLAACGRSGTEAPEPAPPARLSTADLIITARVVNTGVAGAPPAEAVAVRNGRIAAVGSRSDIEPFAGPETQRIDIGAGALFPGFTDSHAHLYGVGERELTLNLEGVGSVEELVDIVAAEVAAAADGEIIVGRGWIETHWPEQRVPTRDDLDPVSPGHPVLLVRADGHALVANSAALDAAGIDASTPDPDGGRIERDARGRANGVLIDHAQDLVAALVADPSPERRRETYLVGAETYAAYGWTGLHNMSVPAGDPPLMEMLAQAEPERFGIRVYNAVEPEGLPALAASGPRSGGQGRIVTRAVKFYVDGALGSRGALLKEPYEDRPDAKGLQLLSAENAAAAYETALKAGLQIATHAIGDAGNTLVLDWYEAAFAATPEAARPVAAPRWRIEHAQILDVADIPRFAALGVVASMQPSHAIGDLYFAPARLGPDRLDGAYAWRALLDDGAVIAGGSDAPVERGDPAIEFYAASVRRGLDGYADDDWRRDQRVSRAEALAMLTRAPAWASFQENDLGTIEVGKKADFTGFDRDLMTVADEEILGAKAVLTVVDGKALFVRAPE